jgi:alpha-tubulin suppressor-like RCC1 family protein
LLFAVLLGSAACQGDRVTGPSPNFATAAAAWDYQWFSAGGYHTCLNRALAGTANWTTLCWGSNGSGELGLGVPPGTFYTRPTAVPNNTGSVFALPDGGNAHHCAISIQRAYCWGDNAKGQLGDGTTTRRSAPVLVQGGIKWSRISAGLFHTCGVNDIGVAYCWGDGSFGALGNGGTGNKLVPTPVSTAIAFWNVDAGSNFTCGSHRALPSAFYCWGYNGDGQLGVGNNTTLYKPGAAVVGGAKWANLAVGYSHACGTTWQTSTAPFLYCWGRNNHGQLGNNQTTSRNQPHGVSGGYRFDLVRAGWDFTCGRRVDTRTMLCWGAGDLGQLGNGFFVDRLTPYPVYGGFSYGSSFTKIAAGWHHMVALRSDNAVVTWGYNNLGQLGDGTVFTRERPVVILPP